MSMFRSINAVTEGVVSGNFDKVSRNFIPYCYRYENDVQGILATPYSGLPKSVPASLLSRDARYKQHAEECRRFGRVVLVTYVY